VQQVAQGIGLSFFHERISTFLTFSQAKTARKQTNIASAPDKRSARFAGFVAARRTIFAAGGFDRLALSGERNRRDRCGAEDAEQDFFHDETVE
jgi:hypothetical protein